MPQLLIHLWGDYILQSDWMAQNKTKRWLPCACHVLLYSLGFLLLRPSWRALAVIAGTHYLIDRYRLARFVVWGKNWIGPYFQTAEVNFSGAYSERHWRFRAPTPSFAECFATGYPPNTPVWLSTWLLIIADNILHLTINAFALRYL